MVLDDIRSDHLTDAEVTAPNANMGVVLFHLAASERVNPCANAASFPPFQAIYDKGDQPAVCDDCQGSDAAGFTEGHRPNLHAKAANENTTNAMIR